MCISGNFHTANLVIEWKKTPIQPPKHKSWIRPEILLRFVFQWIDFGCHATMKNVLQIIDWRENWTTRLSDTGRPRTRTSNEAEYYFKSLSEKWNPSFLSSVLETEDKCGKVLHHETIFWRIPTSQYNCRPYREAMRKQINQSIWVNLRWW